MENTTTSETRMTGGELRELLELPMQSFDRARDCGKWNRQELVVLLSWPSKWAMPIAKRQPGVCQVCGNALPAAFWGLLVKDDGSEEEYDYPPDHSSVPKLMADWEAGKLGVFPKLDDEKPDGWFFAPVFACRAAQEAYGDGCRLKEARIAIITGRKRRGEPAQADSPMGWMKKGRA